MTSDEQESGAGRGRAQRPPRRLAREERTIAAMIAMYCRDHHGDARGGGSPCEPEGPDPRERFAEDGLCADCAELLTYARVRLEKCRYGAEKPTCAKCTTHCYRPELRERVRAVMRYSGPRMLKEHPVLAVAHLADGRKTPGS